MIFKSFQILNGVIKHIIVFVCLFVIAFITYEGVSLGKGGHNYLIVYCVYRSARLVSGFTLHNREYEGKVVVCPKTSFIH